MSSSACIQWVMKQSLRHQTMLYIPLLPLHQREGGARRVRGRGRWNNSYRPKCQICEKMGHTALNCYFKFNTGYSSNRNQRNNSNPSVNITQSQSEIPTYFGSWHQTDEGEAAEVVQSSQLNSKSDDSLQQPNHAMHTPTNSENQISEDTSNSQSTRSEYSIESDNSVSSSLNEPPIQTGHPMVT